MNDLLKNVMAEGFAMQELALYLDTHPDCAEGLQAFREARDRCAAARDAYEQVCGPLTQRSAAAEERWSWVARPWPWEGEE